MTKNSLFDTLQKRPGVILSAIVLLILLGVTLILFSLQRSISIIVDGQTYLVDTFALTPGKVLKTAGISINEEDKVNPAINDLFFSEDQIVVERAQLIQVINGDKLIEVVSTDHVPSLILNQAGINLRAEDLVIWNGIEVPVDQPLQANRIGALQYKPAYPVKLNIDGNIQTIYSAQPTLGLALQNAGIDIKPEDSISMNFDTKIDRSLTVSIVSARKITINTFNGSFSKLSPAQSVSEALLDLGIRLQASDYTNPNEKDPIPNTGIIDLVSVKERLNLLKEETAYEVTYAPDPNAELDQDSVIQPGVLGRVITRSRIRFENGEEVARRTDEPWQASEAQPAVLGYGTKVVVRTENVDGVNIEYYRKISAYATSYSPSRLGVEGLYSESTASGIKLEKGIVAVLVSWYRAMKLQPVYIPGYGYGIIADTGGGIPGTPWIDLGYSDDDWVSWHSWVTMYLLTPVPTYIPYLLP